MSESGCAASGVAHHVERVAVAPLVRIEPRHDLERADFGFVAAPNGRQRLEFRKHVVAPEVAERVAKRRLVQPALRRRRMVPESAAVR